MHFLLEASMKLFQLAYEHYTHQLEVEKTIQGQTLSTMNEIVQNPKLTKNEKTTLEKKNSSNLGARPEGGCRAGSKSWH